jgi:hypothetical protein
MIYLTIALTIYGVSLWIQPLYQNSHFMQYGVNGLLLLGFTGIAFVFERRNNSVNLPN